MFKLRKRPKKPEPRKVLNTVKMVLFPQPRRFFFKEEDPKKRIYKDEWDFPPEGYNYDWDEPEPGPSSIKDIIDYFKSKGITDLSEILPSYDFTVYDRNDELGHVDTCFEYTEYESEEAYEKRIDKYNAELADYKKWRKDNRDEIRKTKFMLKEKEVKEASDRKLKIKKERLLKQKEELEKELKRLND